MMVQTATKTKAISEADFFADILAAIDFGKTKPEELPQNPTAKLNGKLNQFIEAGITFEVSADDFQVIGNNQILKPSDREFLEFNDTAILCTLQQSLLMKHLFSHSPEQFEDFAFEIREREAIMTDEEESFLIHCEAVKEVTKKWFADLLNNI